MQKKVVYRKCFKNITSVSFCATPGLVQKARALQAMNHTSSFAGELKFSTTCRKVCRIPGDVATIIKSLTASQNIQVNNVEVGINKNGQAPLDWIKYGNGKANVQTNVFRRDPWVLPFLNAFVQMPDGIGHQYIKGPLPGLIVFSQVL